MSQHRFETLQLHAGQIPDPTTKSRAVPIYQTTSYTFDNAEHGANLFALKEFGNIYTRIMNPTTDVFEKRVAALEGGVAALATASGQSAQFIALTNLMKTGDNIVSTSFLYGGTYNQFKVSFKHLGLGARFADGDGVDSFAEKIDEKTKAIYIETMGNPRFNIPDFEGLARLAEANGIPLVVDNTFATPAICKPLALGADLVMESVSKFMNGHGDVMLGMLAGKKEHWSRVEMVNAAWGFASSPLECWLACRGVSTLTLRMRQASATALAVAELLNARDDIESVEYPGLPHHPDFELASKQFQSGFGHMVTFELAGGREAAGQLIASQEIPFCPSLGDVGTTLSHPVSTSHRGLSAEQRLALGITDGTIRLSVGVEPTEDVLESLKKALPSVS